MDARSLYPHSFHPVKLNLLSDIRTPAWSLPRSLPFVHVKYYFINLDYARFVSRELLRDCATEDNPFKKDVFDLGEVLRTEVHHVRIPCLSLYSPSCD